MSKYEEARDKEFPKYTVSGMSSTVNEYKRAGADWSRGYHRDIMQRIESHRDGLVKTIEDYENQNQELQKKYDFMVAALAKQTDEYTKAIGLLRKVEGVVDFYKNADSDWDMGATFWEVDNGEKARSILPEIRKVLKGGGE